MSDAPESKLADALGKGIERKLGLPICTALVVGNMVGSGIFLLPSAMAEFGTTAIMAWGLSSLAALALATVLARLSRRMSESGGPMAFTYRALGPQVGAVVAWSYWLSLVIGNAAVAVALSGYIAQFLPGVMSHPWARPAVALGAIWLFTGINARSTYGAGRLQLVSTVLKVLPLLALVIVAAPHVELANFKEAPRRVVDLPALGTLAMFAFWAFVGLESATISTEVIDRPKHTVPRATLIGTAFVCILYLLVMTVTLGSVPSSILAASASPLTEVASRTMGTMGATVMSLAGVVCMIASLNGFILITGYLGQAAATRGIFPSALAAMTGPMRTPRHALMAAAVISSLVVLLSAGESLLHEFAFVCGLATSAMLVPYIMSCVAEPFHLWRLKTTPAIRMVGITLFNLLTVLYIGWGVISARDLFAPWVLAVVLCGVMLLGMRRLSRKKGVGKA